MRHILLDGLFLPLELYLQPTAFRQLVRGLAPALPPDYSLWQARRALRDPVFRHAMMRLLGWAIIALFWVPMLLSVFTLVGYSIDWEVAAAGVAWGVAGGVAGFLSVSHLLFFPLEAFFCVSCRLIARIVPRASCFLWRLSPVRWDEVILIPLPGLAAFLVGMSRSHPAAGREAIAVVAAHRYQYRAAQQALVVLAQEAARGVASLPQFAAFQREVDWLSDDARLPAATRTLLLRMRDISEEVASALASDSVTNRVRRLTAAADMLSALQGQPRASRLLPVAWATLVQAGLAEAQRQQREQEPVPQVYITDGRPLRPADRPETALPFKGRAALFRQLEAALGGTEGERATLVLYGQRRTGKTSVLLQLPRRLGSQYVPAFLDVQSPRLGGANTVAGLLHGVAEEVGKEARRHRGMSLPDIDQAALRQDPYPALERWLDQVEGALGARTLLLCLDEFEALEEAIQAGRLDTRLLATLRHIMQHRRRIAVLFSGSHQLDELPAHWASALVTTTTLAISFLDVADTRELIERPVEGFPDIYTPDAVERMLQITHCQPYLVQLLCAVLVEGMNAQRRAPPAAYVTVGDVETAVPRLLERGANYFLDLWRVQTGSPMAQRLLQALAQTPDGQLSRMAVGQLAHDAAALHDAVATLLRREIIERVADAYRITVPLVQTYVRSRTLV